MPRITPSLRTFRGSLKSRQEALGTASLPPGSPGAETRRAADSRREPGGRRACLRGCASSPEAHTHTPDGLQVAAAPAPARAREACASARAETGPLTHSTRRRARRSARPARARKWALSRPLPRRLAPAERPGTRARKRALTHPRPTTLRRREGSHTARYAEFPTMPDYDISASLDLLLSAVGRRPRREPQVQAGDGNWGAQTAANYKSVWKAESKPALSLAPHGLHQRRQVRALEPRRQGRLDRQGPRPRPRASVRRRRSERGRPSAVTGGGAVGGYRPGTRPLSRFRSRAAGGGSPTAPSSSLPLVRLAGPF